MAKSKDKSKKSDFNKKISGKSNTGNSTISIEASDKNRIDDDLLYAISPTGKINYEPEIIKTPNGDRNKAAKNYLASKKFKLLMAALEERELLKENNIVHRPRDEWPDPTVSAKHDANRPDAHFQSRADKATIKKFNELCAKLPNEAKKKAITTLAIQEFLEKYDID